MESTYEILKALHDHQVEFILIGGMAGVLHGVAVVTEDVDVCLPFREENLSRLLAAIGPWSPRHRMPSHRPPLKETAAQLEKFKNLHLVTDVGQLDVLSEIELGTYAQLELHADVMTIEGNQYRVLSLDALIADKEKTRREKDRQVLMALKAVRERLGQ